MPGIGHPQDGAHRAKAAQQLLYVGLLFLQLPGIGQSQQGAAPAALFEKWAGIHFMWNLPPNGKSDEKRRKGSADAAVHKTKDQDERSQGHIEIFCGTAERAA